MTNKQSGFTLIEALVVGVIVAILAAAAIPMYSGFIDSQEKSSAKSLAQTAAVWANGFCRRNNRPPRLDELQANVFISDPTHYTLGVHGDTRIITVTITARPTISDTAHF